MNQSRKETKQNKHMVRKKVIRHVHCLSFLASIRSAKLVVDTPHLFFMSKNATTSQQVTIARFNDIFLLIPALQVNKTLVEDIERANADLRIAVDASADCS